MPPPVDENPHWDPQSDASFSIRLADGDAQHPVLSLSHTHTHTLSLTHTHSHTHTLSPTLSLSHTLSLTHTASLTHTLMGDAQHPVCS